MSFAPGLYDEEKKIDSGNMGQESDNKVSYCQVLIVGAGVSGLQCARSLTVDGPLEYEDVILLEARNRVGGRVYTRKQPVPRSASQPNNDGANENFLWVDDGAAWVHGIDPVYLGDGDDDKDDLHVANQYDMLENPVFNYLDRKDLNQVVEGNPWTRPYTVLHKTQNIALYMQSKQSTTLSNVQQPFLFLNKRQIRRGRLPNNNNLIQASMRRHFKIMDAVAEQVNEMYKNGLGMEANTKLSLRSCLEKEGKDIPMSVDDNEIVLALTQFWQHMITTWQGLDLKDIPAGQYGDAVKNQSTEDDPDDSDSGSSSGSSSSDSSSEWEDAEFEQDGDFGGSHCTVRGGMHTVVQNLANPDLLHRVHLGEEVVQIRKVQSDDSDSRGYNIRVETSDGSIFYSQSCVVTIPVGCLRETYSKLFVDPLTPEKQEAFQFVTMGKYKKVFLTFESTFWAEKPAFLGLILPNKAEEEPHPLGTGLLVDNLWARDGNACFEVILAGDQAVWATHKPDQVIRDVVLDFIQRAMNLDFDLKDTCLDCHITRWEEDPYSRGAYAGLALGGLFRHIEAFQEPEWDSTLYFAGDASSFEFEGSVPAAILSGRFTARKVQGQLGFSPSVGVKSSTSTNVPMYENYSWHHLSPKIQEAASLLGYTKSLWNNDKEPPVCDEDWRMLTDEQKHAARALGYNESSWDES